MLKTRKIALFFILVFLMLPVAPFSPSLQPLEAELSENFEIYDNAVVVNDSRVYLSARPHTITSSGWVEFTLISKQYSGDIDIVWGFNDTTTHPSKPQIWDNESTFYDWKDVTLDFTKKTITAKGMDIWYILKNVNVEAGKEYKLRCWVEIPFTGKDVTRGKYAWGIKLSSDTIQEAIAYDRFYFMDPWYNALWLYRIKITVDSGSIDEALTDFPVYVHLNSSRLDWASVQDDLDDLRFTSDDEITLLAYEIENYTANTDAWLWVKLPTVSNTSDTDFFLYYGNTGATSGEDKTGTWNDEYVMVQHMVDETTSTILDSTQYDSDGVKVGANEPQGITTGYIDGAQEFDAVNDYIAVNHALLAMEDKDFTFEVWGNLTQYSPIFLSTILGGSSSGAAAFVVKDDGTTHLFKQGTASVSSGLAVPLNVYTYLTVTFDSTANVSIFTVDSDTATQTFTHDFVANARTNQISRYQAIADRYWNGTLDEIRVSNITRSPAWIKASYETGRNNLLTFESPEPGGMEQVIFGGYYDLLDDTDTEYNSLIGGQVWTVNENRYRSVVSTYGLIKQFRVKLNGAPGAGNHYDFTLMLNGAPTALTLEIADAATTGSNLVNGITVTPGDTVTIECNPDSTPTERRATWTLVFDGGIAKESLILGSSHDVLNVANPEYSQVGCGDSTLTATENDFRQVVPTSGTLKDFYVYLTGDPGTAPDAYKFTVRLNGASPSNGLNVTITANDVTGSDLVNDIAVVAGDILTLMIEPLNVPTGTPYAGWGMTFVADTDGESIVLGGSSDTMNGGATEYNYLSGDNANTWGAELQRYQLGQGCTISKLYVLLSAAPGAGKSYDFTLRTAGADSDVTVHIHDTDTTGNSGALSDTVANDNYMGLASVPTGTPTNRDAYWGFVCYTGSSAIVNDALDSDATFSRDVSGWVNVTVSKYPVAALDTVDIQVNTSSDSENFTLRWTQSTGVFSEVSDSDGICTLNTTVSERVNIDGNTDQLCFQFTMTGGTDGLADVKVTSTDDDAATDVDTYVDEFTYSTYSWTGIYDLIDSAFDQFFGGPFNFMAQVRTYLTGLMVYFVKAMTDILTLVVQMFRVVNNTFTFCIDWLTRIITMFIAIFDIILSILDGTGDITTGLGDIWELFAISDWIDLIPIALLIAWMESIDNRANTQGVVSSILGDITMVFNLVNFFVQWFSFAIDTVINLVLMLIDTIIGPIVQ